jgi:hypothetical protein
VTDDLENLLTQGGTFEVRVIDGSHALLAFFGPDGSVAVIKLTSAQAHSLSVLLVQAAERIP